MPPRTMPAHEPFRHFRMLRCLAGLAGVLCALTAMAQQPSSGSSPASAQPATSPAEPQDAEPEANVVLRDGQRYSGYLVDQNDDRVLLRIVGIVTTIPRSQVEILQILPPVMTRYRAMREAIDDDDADSLVKLCEWARARGRSDVALLELERILQKNPLHVEARRLKILILSQKELERKAKKPEPARPAPQGKPHAQPAENPAEAQPPIAPRTLEAPAHSARDFPLLTDAQINLIKVYEVDLKDPPRLQIERDVITRLIEQHAGDPLIPATPEGRERLYTAPPAQVLDVMFRIQARDLYERVRVLDQPRSMTAFRDQIHRTLIQNACATSKCHGGSEAGRLQFATRAPNADATVYTNFLILDRTRTTEGKPLLDYDQPTRSALLQMALPRDRATIPHPVVPNPQGKGDLWRPFYRSADDERFIKAIDWLNALYRPRPKYPIDYTPPGLAPKPAPVPVPTEPPVDR